MGESVELFRTRLSYECLGDHVEEVRFDHPVGINSLYVGNACTGGPGKALLRAYARDLHGPSGGRFVPLCAATVPCPEDGFNMVETEDVVTDCMILRGRYERVDIRVRGFCLSEPPVEEGKDPLDEMLALQPLEFPRNPPPEKHQPHLRVNNPALVYMDGFPSPVQDALWALIGFGHAEIKGRAIDMEPPEDAVREIWASADMLCQALGDLSADCHSGEKLEHVATSSSGPSEYMDGFHAEIAELSVRWCELLAILGDRRNSLELNKGMTGLALAVVLCCYRETAVHFLAKGGVKALAAAFHVRGATALMVRYLSCACEMITLATGPLGCAALLGWWCLPENPPPQGSNGDRPANEEETDVIHVPGILQVKVKRKEGQDVGMKEALDGPPHPLGSDEPGSLPPGMVNAKPQSSRISPHSEPSKMGKHSAEENLGGGKPWKSRKDSERRKGKRKNSCDRDEEFGEGGEGGFEWTDDNHAGKEGGCRPGEKEQGSRELKDGQDQKGRRSSREPKERNRDDRKDRKKHKSHHRDPENQSRRDGERKRRDDESGGGRDARRREHDKQGEEVNPSKQKKHRHDEKRKDRRGGEEEGGGNNGKDLDSKTRGRERGGAGGGKSEHSQEKERKRHRHKGKGRSRGREKEEKGSRSKGEKKVRGRSREKKATSKGENDPGSSKEGQGVNLDNGGVCEMTTEASNSLEKPRRGKRPRSVDREEGGAAEGTTSDQAVEVEMVQERRDGDSGPLVLAEEGVNLYDTLLDVLMQPRPEATIACTSRVLQRLRAYEDMIKFQEATASARQKALDECEDEVISHLQQASDALVGISVAIQSLSDERVRAKGQASARGKGGKQAQSEGSIHCPDLEVDACVRECLSAGHLLSTVVTLLQVPEMLPTSSKRAAMSQTFNEGLHSIMVTLVSSPSGLFFLRHHVRDVLDMVSIVVENSGVDKMDKHGWNVVEEVIGLVGHVVRASEAVDVVLDSSITSVNAARAVSTLTEMLQGDITQEAAVLSMSLSGNCVHQLLMLMNSRSAFLKNIQQQSQPSSNRDAKSNNRTTSPSLAAETDEPCDEGCPPSPNALPVLKLLVELGRSSQAWGMARFCDVAEAVVGLMEAERKLWESGCEEGVLELLGRARLAVLFKEKGCGELMEKLAELLPPFSGVENKKLIVKEIDSKAAVQLMKSPEEMGVVLMALNLAAYEFGKCESGGNLSVVYGPGTMPTLERALRCAIEGFLATRADLQWMLLAGDFRGDLSVCATTRRAVMLMQSITQVLDAWSTRLQKGLVEVNGTGFVDAMVKAHSLLTVTSESFGAMSGKGTRSCIVLKARHSIACVLSRWVEMEWGPDIIPATFLGPSSEGSLMGPQEMLCTICLLGDLFPTEWPPAKNPLSGSKSFPPPSNIKMRATLARSLEPCASQFRHLIEFALGSENLLVQCGVVRMCARAAGLGGGMGCFLAEPFIEEIVRLTRRDLPLCTDQWRIAEYLLALCVWPAMKAALLDLKATSCVSRLIQCIAPQCREDSGAVLVCNVLLRVLDILCDPDVCLNSLTTLNERLRSDLPSSAETAVMVPALLSSVKHLQGCGGTVLDLLMSISQSPAGKLGIIRGISKWHLTSGSTSNSTSQSGGENSRASILWAASQIRECQEGQVEVDPSLSKIASFLDELEDPGDHAAKTEPVLTAPNRFKNAVQAAVQFAASSSGDSGVGFGKAAAELPDVHPLALVYDASTQHYWRYAKPQEALKALRRPWVKWPGESPDLGPATSFYGKGLVGASRPRQVQRGVYLSKPGQERSRIGIGISPRGSPREDMNVEVPVLRRGSEQPVIAQPPPPQQHHLHQGPPLHRPGTGDLPPVFAPPRRGAEGRRIRSLGSSRAPSIHVDAFQRRDGGSSDLGGVEGPDSANGSQDMVWMAKSMDMREASNLGLGGSIAERPLPHHPEPPSQKHDFGMPQQQQEKHDLRKSAPEAPKQKQPFTISLPPRARREPPLSHVKPVGRDPRTGVYHPVNRLPTHHDSLQNDGKLRGPVAVVHSDGSGPSSMIRPPDAFHRRMSNTPTVPMRKDPDSGLVRGLNIPRAAPRGSIPKQQAGEVNGFPLMGGLGRVEGGVGSGNQETSPQAPQLSPETSGPESGVDRELYPSGGTSVGPSSPNVALAAGSLDASNITKDNVKSLLHNPSTMREILKNHPQLVAALQAKLGQSKSDA